MFFFLLFLAFLLVSVIFNALAKEKREESKADKPKEQPRADSQVSAIDMTPPVLNQQVVVNDIQSTAVPEAVASEKTILAQAITTALVRNPKAGNSKVTRKGTANDPAKWACPKSFYGPSYPTQPFATRSADPRRLVIAKRRVHEAFARSTEEQKDARNRARRYKAKLKAYREALANADSTATKAISEREELELLQLHLAQTGVIN